MGAKKGAEQAIFATTQQSKYSVFLTFADYTKLLSFILYLSV